MPSPLRRVAVSLDADGRRSRGENKVFFLEATFREGLRGPERNEAGWCEKRREAGLGVNNMQILLRDNHVGQTN